MVAKLRGRRMQRKAATSTAHPLESRPHRVKVVRARQAADVVEVTVRAPIPDQREAGTFAHAARRLAAARAMLGSSESRPVAAGALLAFVPEALHQLRGLFLRGTRYTGFDQELTPLGPGLGG
jgi:hypothetical protein